MAWIHITPEAEAHGALRQAYDFAASARGFVADILKVHGVHPQALLDHLQLYRELMFGESELTRVERETLAVAVSAINRCRY